MVYPQIPLTSTKVFVSLALFNLLNFPLVMFPSVLSSAVEASVAFSRLRKFLVNEELDPEAVIIEPYPRENLGPDPNQNTPLVEIVSGSFKWGSGSPVLDEINIRCPDRSLVAIAGPVGSGKSSMLSAILGDMTRTEGSVFVRGTVAYAAQSPWIMNSTLRDNVLFGHQFDQAKYDKVLDACGLRSDIQILPGGDMVEIGERGINLSGGQKARVGLARAVYADADIYLLDDTLSAVDSHVARHIFDNVIGPRGLLKDKARIFVTHAISFLPEVDSIYLILDGRIRESGPYHSLIAAKGELHRLITEFGFGANEDEEAEPDALDGIDIEDESGEIPETHADLVGTGSVSAVNPSSSVETPLADGNLSSAATPRRRSRATSLSAHGKEGQPHQVDNQKSNGAANAKGNGELMTKEESARGAVDLSVYSTYAEACGIGAVVIYLVILAVSQATSVMQTFWLAGWSRDNDLEQSAPAGGWTVGWRIGIYGTLGVLYCVTAFIQTVLGWVLCGIRAARTLHNGMLQSVVRLPQSWFDTTSMGRVLNRFSRDMLTVDETIPRSVRIIGFSFGVSLF